MIPGWGETRFGFPPSSARFHGAFALHFKRRNTVVLTFPP